MRFWALHLLIFTLIGCVEQIDLEEIANEKFLDSDIQFCVQGDCANQDTLIVQFKNSVINSKEGSKAIVEIIANKVATEDRVLNISLTAGINLESNEYSVSTLSPVLKKGSNITSFEISFSEDSMTEANETISLQLASVQEGLIGSRSQALINIADGAPPKPVIKPGVSFAFTSYDISEGAQNVIVPIKLSQPGSRDVVINFTSNRSSEIEIKPEILTIPAGTLASEIVINFKDNSIVDGNRELLLTMISMEGSVDPVKGKALFKIVDNDMEKPPMNGGGAGSQVNGLIAEYWNNKELSGTPVKTEVVDLVNNDFGNGSPDALIGNDNFSIRYSGQIYIQNPGSYTFHVRADDGVRLWIDNQLLVDKFIDQGPTTYTASVMFDKQSSHNVKIEYYENGGGSVIQFLWTQNNQVVAVPKSVLYATSEKVIFEELAFLSPTNNDKVKSEFDLSASCFNGSNVTLSGDLSAPVTKPCVNSQFNHEVRFSTPGQNKQLRLQQTVNGQVLEKNITISIDDGAPILELITPDQYAKVNQLVTITGKCETDLALSITGIGVRFPLKSVCTFGEFSRTVSLTSGDGLKSIMIDQYDDAGNKTQLSLVVENKESLLVDNGSGGGSGANVSFNQAKSVLTTYCIGCHKAGGQASKWNFDYDQEEDFIKNNYVVAGDPKLSKLIQRTKFSEGENDNMPLGVLHSTFKVEDYQILYDWVASMNNVELKIEPFKVNKNIHHLLGFEERVKKLDYLFGSSVVNANRAKILENRYQLGDFNYAQGVSPNLDWNSTRILLWQELVEPLCKNTGVASQFANQSGMTQFLERAYGRKIENHETAMINEVRNSGLNSSDQFGVFCLAITTSGEFVSK